MNFPTQASLIEERINQIDPVRYGKSRNFLNGSVTRLSPYISRGYISTRDLFDWVTRKNYSFDKIEKFIQELAWRDYWQQVWIAKGEAINEDLKQQQEGVLHHQLPIAIDEARTGIQALDKAVLELKQTGYIHNHLRMYLASTVCNIGRSHWHLPARWMYYYLLDADWASNALSWQWVAGSNSSKKYFANQENINRYTGSQQRGSFLDHSYEELPRLPQPEILQHAYHPELKTYLPQTDLPVLQQGLPMLIYNFYNIDPNWMKDQPANRVLLLEPLHFEAYPVCSQSIDWAIQLAKDNIPGIQVFTGSFDQLAALHPGAVIHFKEHPLNRHYKGQQHQRNWMFSVKGYHGSFFSFWKKCQREL